MAQPRFVFEDDQATAQQQPPPRFVFEDAVPAAPVQSVASGGFHPEFHPENILPALRSAAQGFETLSRDYLAPAVFGGGGGGIAYQGGEAAAEVLGRYAGQAIGRIGQAVGGLFGRAPAVAPEAEQALPTAAAVERPAIAPPAPVAQPRFVFEEPAAPTAAAAPPALPAGPTVQPRFAFEEPGAPAATSAAQPNYSLAAIPARTTANVPGPAAAAAIQSSAEAAGMTQPILTQPISQRVVAAAGELFTKGGIERVPGMQISDQITDLLAAGKLASPEMDATLQKFGLTYTDFANGMFRPAIADAGRRLQTLSALSQRLAEASPQAAEDLAKFGGGVSAGDIAQPWWVKANNLRRAAMVGQLASAVKRTLMGVARIGVNIMDDTIEAGLQKATGAAVTTDPLEGFQALANVVQGGKPAQLEQILSQFPLARDRLFNTYASDIATRAEANPNILVRGVDYMFEKARVGVDALNVFTRLQEKLIRGSVFQASLAQSLASRGEDLAQVIANGKGVDIPLEDISTAIHKALDTTFALQPTTPIAKGLLTVLQHPVSTFAIPFGRHLINSVGFFFDHSPLGFTRLLSTPERLAMAGGNIPIVAKAVTGTAMLGAAYEFRQSPLASEKWYEMAGPDGRTIDLRPYPLFLPYLFVADAAKRFNEGTLAIHPPTGQDFAQAALTANVRSGTGMLRIIDDAVRSLQAGGGPKFGEAAAGFAGDIASSALVPLREIADVLGQMDQSMRTVRETRLDPFWGPIKAAIPGLAETLPPALSATRAGPIMHEAPAFRQATSVTLLSPKNPLEHELDRLQFTNQDILPGTGDPQADYLIRKHMGPLAEAALVPFVQNPRYMQLSDAQRGYVLQKALDVVRSQARQEAERENPRLFLQLQINRLPARERRLLQERGISLTLSPP